MAGTLTRWDPFAELGELRSGFDRMFGGWLEPRDRPRTPEIDVMRENGNRIVRADMPGIKPEEVKIEVEDDILTFTGEHDERKEERQDDYVRRERRYGSFYRSMVLPAGVDATKITATTHDGVVELTIPLAKQATKGTVTIKATAA